MKHQDEKHSDHVMQFFTPELYVRFSSTDDKEADRADKDWESALGAYREHLDDIRNQMSSQVRDLAAICLHDAELLAIEQKVEPLHQLPNEVSLWSAFGILSVNQNDMITTLVYVLWDRFRENPAPSNWPFSKKNKCWLYDEIDLGPGVEGQFVHRVLFSDGIVLEIPFMGVVAHTFSTPKPTRKKAAKQSA